MSPRDLSGLTAIRAAHVYKTGRLAADLERAGSGTRFAYHPGYVADGGVVVATSLPREAAPVETSGGGVPPFFAGLLPEGRRLTSLRRAVKTSADDELSLLLAVGHDTIGDVQVVPLGDTPSEPESLVGLGRDTTKVRFADVLDASEVVDPVGLPGVQDKASARMISVPVRRAGERYLLKVDPPEFPHVVENEAYFLELARSARMPAAEGRVVKDADGRLGLLVRRFDRCSEPDGSTRSFACEDACQVLGRWPADKYLVTAEDCVNALAECCPARVVAVRDLFRQLVFAWLTGNGDAHAKNLSILRDENGEWRVSPAYDVPATVPYGDTTMALRVQGRTSGLSRRHWLAFADAVGLPQRAAARVLDDLLDRVADLGDRLKAGALPLPQKPTADWVSELRHRHRITSGG